jgi:hypothetical protein
MPVADQDHGGVAVTVTAAAASGLYDALDLTGSEMARSSAFSGRLGITVLFSLRGSTSDRRRVAANDFP